MAQRSRACSAEPAIGLGRRQLHTSHRDPGVTHGKAHPGATRQPQRAWGRRPPRGQAADLHKRHLHRVLAGKELGLEQGGCCAHGTALGRGNSLLPGILWG